jgi:hypothetical protein
LYERHKLARRAASPSADEPGADKWRRRALSSQIRLMTRRAVRLVRRCPGARLSGSERSPSWRLLAGEAYSGECRSCNSDGG